MKRILAIFYTQSGQLKRILDSTLSPLLADIDFEIDYLQLSPKKDFPFPWGGEFFDCFPESVNGIPCEMNPYNINTDNNYDLIVLAYQPWYLSPSIPFWSFLCDMQTSPLLYNKNVITIIGARNMWAGAQEIGKRKLSELGANLIGNIVLQDRADNWIAGITIIKWLIHGKKGPSFLLPAAGVSEKDIVNAANFGEIIKEYITKENLDMLQQELIKAGAVKVKYHLLKMEITARKIFCKFADLAKKKGDANKIKKARIIKLFKVYLISAFFILSPLVSLIFMINRIILFPFANKKINYYKNIELIK